jgi:hypothetical protein
MNQRGHGERRDDASAGATSAAAMQAFAEVEHMETAARLRRSTFELSLAKNMRGRE